MEDVSDPPFRILCKECGADMLYTEFISSGGLTYEAEDSVRKLDFYEEERPLAIQIFGGDRDQVRTAAQIVDQAAPDVIDINFGCPVKKVVRNDGGAAVLKNLSKMRSLAETVILESSRPVTVKTRLGWDQSSIKIFDVVKMLQDIGIQAIALHARTRCQMYKGEADWNWLREIKERGILQIPLIGNGDATSPAKIKAMFEETGVDAVMIGRGAIGNPWIFRDARALLDGLEIPSPPNWQERVEMVSRHLSLKCDWLGERVGVLEMRKMYGGYFRGIPDISKLRQKLMQESSMEGVLEVLMNHSEIRAEQNDE
jgi:nifR3 family TIM-barrel protein